MPDDLTDTKAQETILSAAGEIDTGVVEEHVEEHPISEADAQKFASPGDYNLPVSPLDELIGGLGSDVAKKEETEITNTEPEKKIEMVAAPELTIKEALATQPKADTVGTVKTVDLEQKAKDMLKDLGGTTMTAKPIKKRSGGAATKMALVAVLMVLMGAGGIVGVNLFKMNQTTENRSQAAAATCSGECSKGASACQQDKNGNNTGYNCSCAMVACTAGKPMPEKGVWNCNSYAPDKCPAPNGPPAQHFGCNGDNDAGVKVDGNCLTSSTAVTMWRYFCPNQADLSACMKNGVATNTTKICAEPPSAGWCGTIQVDYNFSTAGTGGCFATRLIPCPTSTPNAPSGPTPTPGPLQCSSIAKSKTPSINDAVQFTCTASGTGINHYEFRYKIDSGDYQSLAVSSGNLSSNLTISTAGTYTAQCRVCKSADATDCTTWGQAE